MREHFAALPFVAALSVGVVPAQTWSDETGMRQDAPSGVSPYNVTEIGALPIQKPPTSSASAINANGAAIGSSAISGGCREICEPSLTHAVLWNGELHDLGVLGPDEPPHVFPRPASASHGVNNFLQVVGDATIVGDGYYHAFLSLPKAAHGLPAGVNEIPRLAVQARAYGINDTGIAVGESRLRPDSLGPRAVRWEVTDGEWTITDLGSFGQEYGIAYGINSLGQITGYATVIVAPFQDNTHAFLWLPEPAYGLPAGLNNLTAGFPAGSSGRGVNELGHVVGHGPAWTPMIWLPEPAYGLPAGVTQFPAATMFSRDVLDRYGLLDAVRGEFYAINDYGVAVGNMEFTFPSHSGLTQRGIVWIDGQFFLTEQLLPPDVEWVTIFRTEGVNNAGQIAATGVNALGESRGLILTPAAR